MQCSHCRWLLQVVEQLNKRSGTTFVSKPVARVNVVPIESHGTGKATCKVAVDFKDASESSTAALYNIASQYAIDVTASDTCDAFRSNLATSFSATVMLVSARFQ